MNVFEEKVQLSFYLPKNINNIVHTYYVLVVATFQISVFVQSVLIFFIVNPEIVRDVIVNQSESLIYTIIPAN